MWIVGNKSSFDPLKPFARQAMVEFVPEFETRRAAVNIAGALRGAGWKITRFTSANDIDDGVEI
jgi:hypothetical protein